MTKLTVEDVAVCLMGVQLGMAWHREQPRTQFRKQELAKLGRINTLLSRLLHKMPEGSENKIALKSP